MYFLISLSILNTGDPIAMPRALVSYERDTTTPSLLESTATGLLDRSGLKIFSQDTKKLLQSQSR